MLKTDTRTPFGRVLGPTLLAALALAAGPAAADETFVVDIDAGTGNAGTATTPCAVVPATTG